MTCSEMDEEWFSHPGRNCRGVATSLFFTDTGNVTEASQAKAVCLGCPVLEQCMEYAVADPTITGIWGATTGKDRRQIRRERGSTSRMARYRKPAECGTTSGYNRHRLNKEQACPSCLEARAAYEAERKARQAA